MWSICVLKASQLFEAVGLSQDVVDLCFKGVTTRIEGANFDDFQQDLTNLSRKAWAKRKSIDHGGLLKYVHGGEYHAYNPDVVGTLQQAGEESGTYNKVSDIFSYNIDTGNVEQLTELANHFLDNEQVTQSQLQPADSEEWKAVAD